MTLPPKTDWISMWMGTLVGDPQSTDEFVKKITPIVFRLFLMRTHRLETARDLTQDFFLSLFEDEKRRLRSFDPSRGVPLPKYLGVIAIRQFINWTRSKGKKRDDETIHLEDCAEVLGIEPGVERQLAERELYEAILSLERSEQIAILLRLLGLRDREIARVMGLPEGTVATLLRRARLHLRDDLGGSWSDPDRGDK